jgi:hypothetical protein
MPQTCAIKRHRRLPQQPLQRSQVTNANAAGSPGAIQKTELKLLGSATNTPSMPRKRKSSAGFSPFGRASRAGKQGGPDNRQKEGKQIESSSSKQHLVSAVQDKMKSIAEHLDPADARFGEGIFCSMGNEGGDVVRHFGWSHGAPRFQPE